MQKTAFHICRDYVDFGVIFTWFSMALGPILMTFGGLGAGLKHYDFRWFSGGVPDGRAPCRGWYLVCFLGPIVILQTVSSSNSTCKIHHETCRNERIRKSRMQITKIRKIKAVTCSHYNRGSRRKIEEIPRSLVAPLRGAGGFPPSHIHYSVN